MGNLPKGRDKAVVQNLVSAAVQFIVIGRDLEIHSRIRIFD